jgi:hypothetical protein
LAQTYVDSYGAQHVGPRMAPITIAFALNGLYLVLERGWTGLQVREAHGYLANTVDRWPTFTPPEQVGDLTVFDLSMASSPTEHIEILQRWAHMVWASWEHVHRQVIDMTDAQLKGWTPRTWAGRG